MDTAQIAELLHPFAELNQQQLTDTLTYIDLLCRWNSRVNLTAVRDPKEIITRHFGESFFAARQLLSPGDAGAVVDLGSGAGFPGLPLAMFAPQAQITLIESNGKKAVFLREVIRSLSLRNVAVFDRRAEEYRNTAILVTMRAVEKFESALVLASRLVATQGRLALMVGAAQVQQAETLVPGFSWEEPLPIPGGHSRVLLVGTRLVTVEAGSRV